MKIVAYSDGERIESIVVYEADLSACLTNLQNEGYLIVGEDKMPEPRMKRSDHCPRPEEDERSQNLWLDFIKTASWQGGIILIRVMPIRHSIFPIPIDTY